MQRLTCFCISLFCLLYVQIAAGQTPVASAEKRVARAQFATAIEDREPVDQITVVAPPLNTVFFFTDLRHMQGHTITHRWEYKGRLMSQASFQVEGPRWRVYSKKVLDPGDYGEWSVTVVDETGWPWYVELFRYDPPRARDVAAPGNGEGEFE